MMRVSTIMDRRKPAGAFDKVSWVEMTLEVVLLRLDLVVVVVGTVVITNWTCKLGRAVEWKESGCSDRSVAVVPKPLGVGTCRVGCCKPFDTLVPGQAVLCDQVRRDGS
jgi:hypothetical protein